MALDATEHRENGKVFDTEHRLVVRGGSPEPGADVENGFLQDTDGRTYVVGPNGAEIITSETLTAENVAFTPAGTISSTNVQDAIEEAASEGGGGGGGSAHTIKDEGTPLTQRSGLNFVGDAVTVTDDAGNDETDVTIDAVTTAELATHTADTTAVHGIADTSALYRAGGTDVAVADGGTGASTAGGALTNLGAQAQSAVLDDLAGLTQAADKLPYFDSGSTAATATFTAAGRALVDDADATAQRTTLGLGSIATQAANNVTITGGSVTGITDLAVADGGTGASTAANARTNLDVPSNAEAVLDTIMDAKGDILTASAADTPARLAVGTDGHVLTADSAQANGIKWAAAAGGGIAATIVDAKGDLIAATAADTVSRLAVGSDGQVLTADSAQSTGVKWAAPDVTQAELDTHTGASSVHGRTIVLKSADETVNNSATLQDDNHLLVAVATSSVYRIELTILTTAANTTADWKFGWTAPTGATFTWGALAGGGTADWAAQGTGTSQKTLTDISTALSVGSAAVNGGFILVGILVTAGTAGNLQFQWAQNTANASDSKVLQNSVLIAQKVG